MVGKLCGIVMQSNRRICLRGIHLEMGQLGLVHGTSFFLSFNFFLSFSLR